MRYPISILTSVALAASSPAQSTSLRTLRNPDAPPQAGVGPWLTPFTSEPGTGEHWAAGPDYKVRVADGVTFFPRLGDAYADNQPLQWRTVAVQFGERTVTPALTAGAVRSAGQRIELERDGFIEAYEARTDGVEQTFLVQRPAQLDGDLQVVGQISGSLHTEDRAPAHSAIEFAAADGRTLVTYGAATAIDAAGRRLPMTTCFAAGKVTLTVTAQWLADATWPVLIDPLLARVMLSTSPNGGAGFTQVVRSTALDRLFVAEARQNAGNDWDFAVRAFADDWAPLGTVFSDLGVTSTRTGALTMCDGANKLVVAVSRQLVGNASVRVYFHPAPVLVANVGTNIDVPRPANTHDFEPSLGGGGGTTGYLALRRDGSALAANTPDSRVFGASVNATTDTLGALQNLHTLAGANYDAERPSVSPYSEAGGWVVAWQEYNYDGAADDWDVLGQRISAGGALLGSAALGQASTATRHKLTPHVAGSGSRFALAYVTRDNTGDKPAGADGTRLYFQRFDWSSAGVLTQLGADLVTTSATPGLRLGDRGVAYDHITDSLWAATWSRADTGTLHVWRFGYDAQPAEFAQVADAAVGSYGSSSVCFDPDAMAFPLVYGSTGESAGDPTYGTRLLHGAASASAYGVSCGGQALAHNSGGSAPYVGSQFLSIDLENGRANAPTVLLAGAAAINVPLPSGGPGCMLLVDPAAALVVLPVGLSDGTGEVRVPMAVPSTTGAADVRWQFVQLDGAVLRSSSGLLTQVR
jgi:hypothetical protein